MTNAELDARCAKLRGWTEFRLSVVGAMWAIPPGDFEAAMVPDYSTSLDACAELEGEIERRGLGVYYCLVVEEQCRAAYGETLALGFHLLTAPPRARAEAFCRVMEENNA